jgi:hypothetical protein
LLASLAVLAGTSPALGKIDDLARRWASTRAGGCVDSVDYRMPAYAAHDEGLFDADPNLLRLRYLVPRCSQAALALPDL